jgi:hypothetical protein
MTISQLSGIRQRTHMRTRIYRKIVLFSEKIKSEFRNTIKNGRTHQVKKEARKKKNK